MDAATSPSRDARRCARPGCADLAVATLAFRYDRQQAWLTTLAADKTPATYDLCGPCADRTAPPRGWELVDERPDLDHLADPVEERDAVRDAIARALRQSGPQAPPRPVAVLPQAQVQADDAGLRLVAPVVDLPTTSAPPPADVDVDVATAGQGGPDDRPVQPVPAAAGASDDGPVPSDDASVRRSTPVVEPEPEVRDLARPRLGLDAPADQPRLSSSEVADGPEDEPSAAVPPPAAASVDLRSQRPRRRRRPVEVLLDSPPAGTPATSASHAPGRHAPVSHRLAPVVLGASAAPQSFPAALRVVAEQHASTRPGSPVPAPVGPSTPTPTQADRSAPAAAPAMAAEAEPVPPGLSAVDVPLAFDALPDRLVDLAGPSSGD